MNVSLATAFATALVAAAKREPSLKLVEPRGERAWRWHGLLGHESRTGSPCHLTAKINRIKATRNS